MRVFAVVNGDTTIGERSWQGPAAGEVLTTDGVIQVGLAAGSLNGADIKQAYIEDSPACVAAASRLLVDQDDPYSVVDTRLNRRRRQEDWPAFMQRLGGFIGQLQERHTDQDVLVVTHAEAAQGIHAVMSGLELTEQDIAVCEPGEVWIITALEDHVRTTRVAHYTDGGRLVTDV